MLGYIVALIAIGYVAGQHTGLQNHRECHGNALYTELEVISKLAEICDRNHDGIYKEAEIVVGFAQVLQASHKIKQEEWKLIESCQELKSHALVKVPFSEATILGMNYQTLVSLASLAGFTINRADFIAKWTALFHDSTAFAASVFDAFDDNKNQAWSIIEVDNILKHIHYTHDDGNGIINHNEFIAFFAEDVYKC